MSLIAEIQTAASGKWPAVLRALGVDVPEKQAHIPCPVCGGKDRFHFKHDDVGSSYCRGCNKWRDGLQLARDCGHDIRDIAHCAGIKPVKKKNAWQGEGLEISEPTRSVLDAKRFNMENQRKIREREELRKDCLEAAILWHEYEKNGRPFEETRRLFRLHRQL
ncbi:TPA: primase-helicase zinc-binding domain-containing protein [Escherichia coli]